VKIAGGAVVVQNQSDDLMLKRKKQGQPVEKNCGLGKKVKGRLRAGKESSSTKIRHGDFCEKKDKKNEPEGKYHQVHKTFPERAGARGGGHLSACGGA